METVYRLRDDRRHINDVQEATLHTRDFGLKQTHGLFGSDEWWKRIANGELPLHILRGTISRVFMSGHNDFAECEVTTALGDKTCWQRYAEDAWYRVGSSIEIDYVLQQPKRPTDWLSGPHKVVVEVRIAHRV